jgi:hypothetical protein
MKMYIACIYGRVKVTHSIHWPTINIVCESVKDINRLTVSGNHHCQNKVRLYHNVHIIPHQFLVFNHVSHTWNIQCNIEEKRIKQKQTWTGMLYGLSLLLNLNLKHLNSCWKWTKMLYSFDSFHVVMHQLLRVLISVDYILTKD